MNLDSFISRLYLAVFGEEEVHNGNIVSHVYLNTMLYFKSSIPDCFLVSSLLKVFSITSHYVQIVHSG